MKHLLMPLLVLPLLIGCKSTPMSHAIFTAAITTGEEIALIRNPELTPDLRAGASVVCSVANGTNATPDAIVAALEAAHITNVLSRIVLQSSLSIFNTVVAAIGTNQNAEVRAYASDLCSGLEAGLPPKSIASSKRILPIMTSPHLQ